MPPCTHVPHKCAQHIMYAVTMTVAHTHSAFLHLSFCSSGKRRIGMAGVYASADLPTAAGKLC